MRMPLITLPDSSYCLAITQRGRISVPLLVATNPVSVVIGNSGMRIIRENRVVALIQTNNGLYIIPRTVQSKDL